MRDDDDVSLFRQRAGFAIERRTARAAVQWSRTREQLKPGEAGLVLGVPPATGTFHEHPGTIVQAGPGWYAPCGADDQASGAPAVVTHDDGPARAQQRQHRSVHGQYVGLEVRNPRQGCRLHQRVEQVRAQPAAPSLPDRHPELPVSVREQDVPGLTDDPLRRGRRAGEHRDEARSTPFGHRGHVGVEVGAGVMRTEEPPIAVIGIQGFVQRHQLGVVAVAHVAYEDVVTIPERDITGGQSIRRHGSAHTVWAVCT